MNSLIATKWGALIALIHASSGCMVGKSLMHETAMQH